MTRLDLIPDNSFTAEFKRLRQIAEDIKSKQRIGKDILKPKIVEALDANGNPTVYDLVATWDAVNEQVYSKFVATMTADHQAEPWATPLYRMYIGSPGNDPLSGETGGSSYLNFANTVPGKIAYSGDFGANVYMDKRNVYLKVYFYATDTGTLVVTT